MLLKEDKNTFTDDELFNCYDKLHSIHHGHKLIQFLLKCNVDENKIHYWIGNTTELARILGIENTSNFRTFVIQPLIDKNIVIKEMIKRKTVKYSLNKGWKNIIFS